VLGDPRDAEEVTQDVLVAVIRQIRLFKGAAAFASWIYRIAANAAYGKLRMGRRARSEVLLEESEGRHAERVSDRSREPFEAAVAGEVRAAIERGLAELPSDYRAVILLRDVEGLPNGEVAGILGLSTAAVKSRVHRARLILRKALAPVTGGSQRSGRTV